MKWNIHPEIFRIGPIAIRYYSLMFVIGFVSMDYYVKKLFVKHGEDPRLVSVLTNYIVIGMIVGARLAHCLFYDPGYYLSNPLDILMIWKGGLASHGGFAGVIAASYFFLRKHKELKLMWLLDLITGPCIFVGSLIRIGNFFNSEIVGTPTDLPWAIIFEKIDYYPRHPAQLYESIGYFSIAVLINFLATKKFESFKRGTFLYLGLILCLTFRFFIEFTKDNQSSVSEGLAINMGQMLSLGLGLIAAGFLVKLYRKKQ